MLYIVSGLFIDLLVLCFTSLVSFKGFNTEDEPNLYFTSKARDNLESFILFITIKTIVKLNLVHVLQTRENLVISSCFFLQGRQRNVPRIKTHVHNHCPARYTVFQRRSHCYSRRSLCDLPTVI